GAPPPRIWQKPGGRVVARPENLAAAAPVVGPKRDAPPPGPAPPPRGVTAEAARHQARLMLPMPDGSYARFSIEASSVMEPGLAARFPEVRSYRGQGLDDPALSMRCDLSPRGFHVTVLHGAQFIR